MTKATPSCGVAAGALTTRTPQAAGSAAATATEAPATLGGRLGWTLRQLWLSVDGDRLWLRLLAIILALLGVLAWVKRVRCRQRKAAQIMVVLDFDKTITVDHTDGIQPQDLESRDTILANVRDPHFLVQFCKHMAARGYCVGIASYSDHRQNALQGTALVIQYLRAIFHPLDFTDYIPLSRIQCWNPDYTDAASHAADDHGKNLHLKQLAAAAGGCRTENIILIDDDQHNVAQARKDGYRPFWCGDAGFTRDFFERTPELVHMLFADGLHV